MGFPKQTILDVCRENGIEIPTLCFDERTEVYGACGLCVVEVAGNNKLLKACATEIDDGMSVLTNTQHVRESRRTNLELLLSNHTGDCRGPCELNCPAGTDCQGYVGLIANGENEAAIELIKERIPLPASIGRVCPHPCETACRRGLVEKPVSIASLKRFAADLDLAEGGYTPQLAPSSGRSVAVIGGGPYGLSVAYFLKQKGHDVTIFDAMPKLGGMLRYGIPEYRLPKEVLDAEIALIARMGVRMFTNTKIGGDISLNSLRAQHDAVVVGIGAWVSTGTGAAGENLPGVFGGIDFLRAVQRGETLRIGESVAIVGGGNTAMDACRTAVRLGAKRVYNIYRRTKDEMPADAAEIEEAGEEGVIFKNLTNPLEITAGPDGRANGVVLQVMRLGEPDASGRRAPVPVEGETETLEVSSVILATGQAVNPEGFEALDLTRKKGIVYDKNTFMTSIPGVFAGGDCGNDKISIAVESIADAIKSAEVIDAYLHGEEVAYKKPYVHERDDVTEKTFEDRERRCRQTLTGAEPEIRRESFLEVYRNGFTPEQAADEASRCLECGCCSYFECKLLSCSRDYNIVPERFAGEKTEVEFEDTHPFVVRDPHKCVLCGLCVRVCDEVVGVGALGLIDRGFDVAVKPALGKPLAESGCVSCGMCISVCPTGALQQRQPLKKPVPLKTEKTDTTCAYCSVGCSINVQSHGNLLVKCTPDKQGVVNQGYLCHRGRFGFGTSISEDRLKTPLARERGELVPTEIRDAVMLTAKALLRAQSVYGRDAAAIAISPRLTNEEIYAAKYLADSIGARTLSFENVPCGLADVLGADYSPNTIDELLATDMIIAVGFDPAENPVVGLTLRRAARREAKIVHINPFEGYGDFSYSHENIQTENSVEFLREVLAALLLGGKTSNLPGFDALRDDLRGVTPSDAATRLAELYSGAKAAMLVFQQSVATPECATLLADIALVSGHFGKARDGILQVKSKSNSQGLVNLGVTGGTDSLDGVKALLIFGENPSELPESLDFLAVCDTHLTDAAQLADVVIPGTAFAATDGTFTNTEGRLMPVQSILHDKRVLTNWQIAQQISRVFEKDAGWRDVSDLSDEMTRRVKWYSPADVGTIVYSPAANPTLRPVRGGALTARKPGADYLRERIDAKVAAAK
jgi:formate dehydrogenase major subunit